MAMMSKCEQAEKYLREAISRGKWKPGDALPSERDLLLELGISRTTLRDALNLLANDGVLVRRSRLGTFVADRVSTGVVGVLVEADDLTAPFGHWFKRLVEEGQSAIAAAGYRPMLMVGQGESAEAFLSSVALLEKSLAKDTVGVLSLTHTAPMENYLRMADIQCVTIGPPELTREYSVSLDMEQLVKLGIDTLKAHGHDDFAMIDVDRSGMPLYEMSKEFDDRMAHTRASAMGFRDDRLVLIPWTPSYEHAYQAFKDWWAREDRPSALFFLDDPLCDISTRAILELGIKVPDDLAIITLGNVGRSFHFPVPITSVGFDPAKTVSTAMNMLQRLINGQEVSECVVQLKPVLTEGRSL